MDVQGAGRIIAAKLSELNATHLAVGGSRTIECEDWTWSERTRDIVDQARYLLTCDRPSMDLLAAVGARVLAAMVAVDEAEMVDVASGEDAAA